MERDGRSGGRTQALREYKEKDRVRYIGVTTTFESQYAELVQTMRNEPNAPLEPRGGT